jgi:hypothetical protein
MQVIVMVMRGLDPRLSGRASPDPAECQRRGDVRQESGASQP